MEKDPKSILIQKKILKLNNKFISKTIDEKFILKNENLLKIILLSKR